MEQYTLEDEETFRKSPKPSKVNRYGTICIIGTCIVAGVAIICALIVGLTREQFATGKTTHAPLPTPAPRGSALGKYRFAAVAADDAHCSSVGVAVLAEGGTAVDAAIASLICNGVRNAHSMGVGGGFVMTYYNRKKGTSEALISREMAPGGATENMYKPANASSTFGGLAVGIPGEIKGYEEAHRKYGRLSWARLFAPTIKLCKEGFPISRALASAIVTREKEIRADSELTRVFVNNATGRLLKEGDMCFRPKLARTLQTIADEGANSFYNGSLSADIVADVRDRGGILTSNDLKMYKSVWKPTIKFAMQPGFQLHSTPTPSSGPVLAFIINILNGYNLQMLRLTKEEEKTLFYHRVAEAFKFAYGKRSALGDGDYWNVTELVKNMTDPDFGRWIKSRITDNMTHDTAYYDPVFQIQENRGTAHISVLAGNGDAVAVTSTINTYFGSKVLGSRTGIIFNNEMDDFSTPNTTNFFGVPASPSNFIRPWKRPMSSMSPVVIVDSLGKVRLIAGASGGTKITTATALVSMQTLWMRQTIKKAIDARRLHHQLVPVEAQLESGFSDITARELEKLGHVIQRFGVGGSVVQGISVPGDGFIYACSDFRKGGSPDGY